MRPNRRERRGLAELDARMSIGMRPRQVTTTATRDARNGSHPQEALKTVVQ
jgi:hypothetical protein